MVYAKVLYKAMGSYGLWAAVANRNIIYSLPIYRNDEGRFTFPAKNWVWSNAPMLESKMTKLTRDDRKGILKWLTRKIQIQKPVDYSTGSE